MKICSQQARETNFRWEFSASHSVFPIPSVHRGTRRGRLPQYNFFCRRAWKERRVIEIASAVAGMRSFCRARARYGRGHGARLLASRASRWRRRGILITSFVSLASLHSLMRITGQKGELIGEPGRERKNEEGRHLLFSE